MAILTKNALSASNQASFPNNTTGAITPQILRDFNQDVIDTLVDSLNTGSYAITTGSNDFTQPNNFTSISASSFVSASAFVGDGSKLTNITASVAIPISDEGILQGYATQLNFSGSNISASLQAGIATISVNTNNLVTTSSFNSYTSSNDSKVNSLISATASYANSASVAAVDAAQQSQINSLIASTSSFALTSLNAFTASQETKDATLGLYTASVDQKFSNIGGQSGSWDNTSLNSFTASQNTKNSTLASYTGSNDTKWSNLGSQSGSWITESETGSFAIRTGTNNFTGSQNFGDNINLVGATQIIEGTSTLRIKGQSTILSTTAGDLQLSASAGLGNNVRVTGGNLIVNTNISASQVSASFYYGDGSNLTNLPGAVPLTSLNAFTASQETKNTTLANVTSSLNSFTASQDTKNSTLATYTASVDTKFSTLGTQSGSWITESETASFARTNVDNNFSVNQTFTNITAVSASFQYVQTTYETASVIYSSGSNQFGDELTDIQTLSGSVKIQGGLTINGVDTTGSLNNLNAFTASQDTKNTTLQSVTSSLNSATASLFTSTSLSLTTASFNTGTRNLTFTKGDTSTFSVNIPDVSGSTSGFATLGANTFTGSQTISSSLNVSGSANFVGGDVNFTDQGRNINIDVDRTIIKGQKPTLISQSLDIQNTFTASLATGFTYVGNASGRTTLVATSSFLDDIPLTSLNAFTASQDTKNTTLGNLTGSYATTGSNSFIGSQSISGSLSLTGSAFGNVVSMSVTSNTASMDFSKGNYFELSASVSPIRIEVSNLKGGVTSTLALNGVTSSTINWSSNVLQPSGSAYTASVSGSNDILSFVAFNSGKVNVVSTLKMI